MKNMALFVYFITKYRQYDELQPTQKTTIGKTHHSRTNL
jgi:hypothetical protein